MALPERGTAWPRSIVFGQEARGLGITLGGSMAMTSLTSISPGARASASLDALKEPSGLSCDLNYGAIRTTPGATCGNFVITSGS